MKEEGALVVNGSSSKNFPFVVVSISHMTFLLKEKIEKLLVMCLEQPLSRYHICWFSIKKTLQEMKSRSNIWFPFKFGSMGIVPAGWLETPSYVYVTLTSRVLAFAYAFFVMNTWNTKTMGALAVVCTLMLKSVLGLGNTKNCILLLLCVCNGTREFSSLPSLLIYYL